MRYEDGQPFGESMVFDWGLADERSCSGRITITN